MLRKSGRLADVAVSLMLYVILLANSLALYKSTSSVFCDSHILYLHANCTNRICISARGVSRYVEKDVSYSWEIIRYNNIRQCTHFTSASSATERIPGALCDLHLAMSTRLEIKTLDWPWSGRRRVGLGCLVPLLQIASPPDKTVHVPPTGKGRTASQSASCKSRTS